MSITSFEGHEPSLESGVYIHQAAEVIGEVTIGANSSIWPMSVVRGDVNYIRIGHSTNIQDGSILHVTHGNEYNRGGFPLIVGDEVTVGHGVILHGCTLGNRCLIGMGAKILDGAVVHEGAMVAAGSLVPPGKELEGGYLWMGSPVSRVRALSEDEKNYLEYAAAHYVRLKDRYLAAE